MGQLSHRRVAAHGGEPGFRFWEGENRRGGGKLVRASRMAGRDLDRREVGFKGPVTATNKVMANRAYCMLSKKWYVTGPFLRWEVLFPTRIPVWALLEIEKMRHGHWISDKIYDAWMEVNFPEYRMAASPDCMALYGLRKEHITVMKPGSAILELCRSSDCLVFYKCRIHGVLRVKLTKAAKSRNSIKLLNKVYPWTNIVDKRHTNLDLASLCCYAVRLGMLDEVNAALALCPVGRWNCTATAVVVAGLGTAGFPLMAKLMDADKACCLANESWAGYCQSVGTAVRRNGIWVDRRRLREQEIVHLAYWDLAIGRHGRVSDWVEEKRKRTADVLEIVHPDDGHLLDDELEEAVVGVLAPAVAQCPAWPSWREHCETRQAWVSSGSSGGEKVCTADEVIPIKKRAYFDSVTTSEMLRWPESHPALEATGSEKYEMGKARAIYGSKPVDYAVMAYVIMPLERRLFTIDGIEMGLTGFSEVACAQRRLLLTAHPWLECTMLDYADFNMQHTLRAQAIVFRALSRLFRKYHSRNPDLLKCSEWCAAACLNQWCKFPQDAKPVRTVQGLFSGIRGTNFINTVLNVAYFEVAREIVKLRYGVVPRQLFRIHQGDDVWISNRSRVWAAALYQTMLDMGFVMKASKQLFAIATGEFLRVRYSAGEATGYVMRAVATLIIRPLQSEDFAGPQERAVSLNAQVQLLVRRGCSPSAAEVIWWATVKHALCVKLPDGGGVSVPIAVATKRYADGGLDLGPPGTAARSARKTATLPAGSSDVAELAGMLPDNMSADWVGVMSSKVQESFDSKAIRRALHQANAAGSMRPVDRKLNLRVLERQLKKWREELVPSPCVRTQEAFSELLDGHEHAWTSVQPLLDVLDDVPCDLKQIKVPRGWLESIVSAISASPFQDIATARRGLGLSTIDAAHLCISMCKNERTRSRASGLLNQLCASTSTEVVVSILNGIRSVGPAFEVLLHPVILSWVTTLGTDMAIFDACSRNVRTLKDWEATNDKWQLAVLRTVVRDDKLVRISHY
nr:RNA-directed RNA polymerase [Mute swan feces associated toti-like virus 3]